MKFKTLNMNQLNLKFTPYFFLILISLFACSSDDDAGDANNNNSNNNPPNSNQQLIGAWEGYKFNVFGTKHNLKEWFPVADSIGSCTFLALEQKFERYLLTFDQDSIAINILDSTKFRTYELLSLDSCRFDFSDWFFSEDSRLETVKYNLQFSSIVAFDSLSNISDVIPFAFRDGKLILNNGLDNEITLRRK